MVRSHSDVAIIIPVFNEADTLGVLIERLKAILDKPHFRATIWFIDDGSTDETLSIIRSAEKSDPRFSWIKLSRNFGLQAALTAGLMEVDADATIFMDADLQDPPELIPNMIEEWQNGADVVLARRKSRKEKGFKGFLLRSFHVIMPRITSSQDIKNTGNFGLLSGKAVQALRRLPERNRYFPGLRAWIGFNCKTIHYDREARQYGKASQSLPKLFKYGADAIFSFSYLPLRLLTGIGTLISISGFFLGSFYAIKRLIGIENAFTGFTTIVVLMVCLGGFQLIALGIIGEYLLRIYEEVKGRPAYIVQSSSSHTSAMAEEQPQ